MDSAGAKSVVSRDMQELREGAEEISHRIQGHKANLSNPSTWPAASRILDSLAYLRQDRPDTFLDTSEASKKKSQQAIDDLGGEDITYGKQDTPISKSAAEDLEGTRVAKG